VLAEKRIFAATSGLQGLKPAKARLTFNSYGTAKAPSAHLRTGYALIPSKAKAVEFPQAPEVVP
jgi:hypothetical protein